MPDLAPALLHSEPGPSVPICEGGTAVCLGGQEPASLQAGSLREPSQRRPEGEPRGSREFRLQSALALIHLPSGWAGQPLAGMYFWRWEPLYGER